MISVVALAVIGAGTAAAAPSVYYPNCSAARAAGASNIRTGEPGYRRALDRNGDGVACQSGESAAGTGSTTTGASSTAPSISTPSTTTRRAAAMPTGGVGTGDGSFTPAPSLGTNWSVTDTVGATLLGVGALAGGFVSDRRRRP